MTAIRSSGREWKLYSAYRREGRRWHGRVYWNPSWVAMHLDGVSSRLAWEGRSWSERRLRRRIAKALLRERQKADDTNWIIGGRRGS